MCEDRYGHVAKSLRYGGWLQDLVLRRARKHVVDVVRARRAASVLDACCGAGTLSGYLKGAGLAVIGVDSSPSMLARARSTTRDATFIQGDVTRLALEQRVDAAVIALALHEMREDARSAVWESMKRATRRGGTLVLLDYVPPAKRNLLARLARGLVWKDEESIGRHDLGHLHNFEDFMERGGARSWLLNRGESIVEARDFLFGNLGVLVVVA